MKITIVGGGPAGLYCAIAIKQATPAARIKIYEARNETVNELGLGYTLQKLHLDLLGKIDSGFPQTLFNINSPPKLQRATVRVDELLEERPFQIGYTVSRFELMRYLRALALEVGVKIIQKKVELSDIPRLKKNSSLLIAADGVNSLIRNRYASEFGAKTTPAAIRFCWYYNTSEDTQHKPRFWAVSSPYGVIQMISYPHTDHRQIVIMEMTEDCYQKGQFEHQEPQEIAEFLNQQLSLESDPISLEPGPLPWLPFSLNTTDRLNHSNVALVGEAAFSFHYSFGWGLATAFSMGYTLAQSLKQGTMKAALKTYHHAAMLSLEKPVKKSLDTARWMEEIDHHFAATPKAELIEHYLQRHKYRKILKPVQN